MSVLRIRRRYILLALMLAPPVFVAWLLWPGPPPSGALRGEPVPDGLWIATYNVNFERESPDTIDALTRVEADILFLQETHPGWQARIEQSPLRDAFPHRHFLDHEQEGGMAVLSRHPLSAVQVSEPPGVRFPATCLTVQPPGQELSVLHLHLLPPLDEDDGLFIGYMKTPPRRLAELESHLSCGGLGPFDVILGDLNEGDGPSTEALAAAGYQEAQRVAGLPEPTWAWDNGLWTMRGRPDHIFVAKHLQITAVQVIPDGASDHAALRAQVTP